MMFCTFSLIRIVENDERSCGVCGFKVAHNSKLFRSILNFFKKKKPLLIIDNARIIFNKKNYKFKKKREEKEKEFFCICTCLTFLLFKLIIILYINIVMKHTKSTKILLDNE